MDIMAEPAKKPKKVLSEETKKRKRESDRERARTRVNIGPAYTRWRELKEAKGCRTDGDLALFLLDFDIGTDKVVVKVECLLQLFQKCFECCSKCSIATEHKGCFFYVTQKCQKCHYSREWTSHPPDQIHRESADKEVNDSAIRICDASDSRSNDSEEECKTDHNSCYTEDEMMAEKMKVKEEKFEDEVEVEIEHEDAGDTDFEDEEEALELQDSDDDDDWHPNFEELQQPSTSVMLNSNSSPNAEEEVLLPLVWCCVCGSRFKRSCFRQSHSRRYCCLHCGTKEHEQRNASSSNQDSTSSRGYETCSKLETDSCNNQDISNSDNQEITNDSEQWTTGDGSQENASSQGGTTGSSNQKVFSCKIEEVNIQVTIDSGVQGLTHNGHHVAIKMDSQEASENNTEDAKEEVHSRSPHIEDLAVHFQSLSAFQTHALQCHGVSQFRHLCVDCGKFITMRNTVEGGPPHICEHKVKPFVCPSCGKRFATKIGLQTHITRIHNEKYILSCRYCLKAFKSHDLKQKHEKGHLHETLRYQCPDCPLRFPNRPSWCAHKKSHWPNGKYVCEVCNKGFHHELALSRHEVVHTGLRPYNCQLCERSFNQPGHLKSHMRLHTGERPFKCQDCGQCFNHNVSLKNHIQRYHVLGAVERKGKRMKKKKKKKQQ